MTELNRELHRILQDSAYTLLDVRHEYREKGSSYYRVMHPKLQGHFTIVDRYDYFKDLCSEECQEASENEISRRELRSDGMCYDGVDPWGWVSKRKET